MKTTYNKICLHCNEGFTTSTNSRIFCKRECKDIHLRGSRTSNCEYAAKANKKHNNIYRYDEVDLNNKLNGKVIITCNIHGNFLQDPGQHLIGKGCKLCANARLCLTTEDFINKANKKHNNAYTYKFTEYTSMKEHVIITCPKHGNFYQSPTQHIHHGTGCHTCAEVYRISKGEKEWLCYNNVPDDRSHRQVSIPYGNRTYIVDGLLDNTVYEYLGDYWHGNPATFSASEMNNLAKKSHGDLYLETLNRIDNLRLLGYNVKYIWESEWHQQK